MSGNTTETKPNGQQNLPYATPAPTGPYRDVKPVKTLPPDSLANAELVNKPPQVMWASPSVCRPMPGVKPPTLEEATRTGLLPSIRRDGLLNPGACQPDPDREGHWLIRAGCHRWLCCELLGIDFGFIPIEADTPRSEMIRLSLADNLIRRKVSLLEIADQVEAFSRETGITRQKDLVAALGLPQSELSRATAMPKKLAPTLHDKVRNFELPRSIGEMIASLEDFALQEKAAAHYLSFPVEPVNKRPKRDSFKLYLETLRPTGEKEKKPRPLKLSFGGVTVTIKEGTLAAVKTAGTKLGEAAAAFEKGKFPAETLRSVLPSLLKG